MNVREDVGVGDSVVDADGTRWTVLHQPDGSGVCDGLFLAADGRQQYGENMAQPLLYVRDFAWAGELAEHLPTAAARGRYWNERIDHYFDSSLPVGDVPPGAAALGGVPVDQEGA